VGPHQGTKQQKVTREPRDKRAPSVESQDELERAEMHVPQRTWSPQLEVDGAPIPYNASIWEYQRGQAGYIAEALEQPMDAYRRFSQNELFLSLKRDLAMVRQLVLLQA